MNASDHPRLSRRTILRGAGAAIALPLLDAMLPFRAARGAQQASAPLRTAYIFTPNGMNMPLWTPQTDGADYRLSPTLEPLSAVKDKLLVISGLAHDKARANGDGPGDHARCAATYLTASQARKTHGADIQAGVSVDQAAAERIGSQTPFPSLELGIDRGANAGNCDSGYSCAYSANISWKAATTPNAKEVNPRQAFERLFGGTSGAGNRAQQSKRDLYRASILDLVQEDARGLQRSLGSGDRRKLDEYLSSVREMEQRIQSTERTSLTQLPAGSMAKPDGIPRDLTDHLRLMYDLLALAFQTDMTRIATFMVANAGSNRSYPFLGVSDGHHGLSHHGKNKAKLEKIAKIDRYHVEQFAYFLQKLDSVQEGAGTLLDHCAIMYGCAIADGDRHNHDDLPIVLAGGAGGRFQRGQHIKLKNETPVANLFVSLLQAQGVQTQAFGDSTGSLEAIHGG